MWTLRFLFPKEDDMWKKQIIAIAAIVISGVAYCIAKNAEEKADGVEKKLDTAVKDLSKTTSGMVERRVSDGVLNEAIRVAAEKRVASITKSVASDIKSDIENRVERAVQSAFDKARGELNIADMIRRKAKEIVRNLTADDLSTTLVDDVKDAVMDEFKSQVRRKVADTIF